MDSFTETNNTISIDTPLQIQPGEERSQAWLEQQLEIIWTNHFSDIERLNTVLIKWGRPTRTRLGTITGRGGKYDNPEMSLIRINPLLQDPRVPKTVVWQTIIHEVAHYTHGFCSPHPKKYAHPHRGGVIEQEFVARQLSHIHDEAEGWLKKNWVSHVTDSIGLKRRKRTRRRSYARRKPVSLLSYFQQIIDR